MPLIDAHFGGFFLRDSIDYIQKNSTGPGRIFKASSKKEPGD